jgi:hypothetical protein
LCGKLYRTCAYSTVAPPGWQLKSSGYNGRGHAEVTIVRVGPSVPEPLDLPDGWEVVGWFRHPIDGASADDPPGFVTFVFVFGMFAGAALSVATRAILWLIWG